MVLATAPRARVATAPVPEVTLIEPEATARAARLRYGSDASPGIRRQRVGEDWSYTAADGTRIDDAEILERIRVLAVPPAWSDVWISPHANGHIQATGRDARRRKQYRYHAQWHAVRDETKFGRMTAFGRALTPIREATDAHLRRQGLPRERVLAAVVRLLEATLIRIGNDEYARDNDSYGLTTMRTDHADIAGSTITFQFRGKSGKEHRVGVRDRRLARIVARCQDLPGEDLFQYIDASGDPQTISSSDVNDYLREISGSDFSAKDFRTWNGTVLCAMALAACGPAETEAAAKRNISVAIESVAHKLGNTRAVCRKSYVHPALIDAYNAGTTIDDYARQAAERVKQYPLLERKEAAVLAMLDAAS